VSADAKNICVKNIQKNVPLIEYLTPWQLLQAHSGEYIEAITQQEEYFPKK